MKRSAPHLLNMYHDGPSYLRNLHDRLTPLLWAGMHAVLIVRDAHRALVEDYLEREPQRARQVRVESADEMANRWFVGDAINRRVLVEDVENLRADAEGADAKTVILGEVVDVLLRRGERHKVLALEVAWNEYLADERTVLFCSYHSGAVEPPGGNDIVDLHD